MIVVVEKQGHRAAALAKPAARDKTWTKDDDSGRLPCPQTLMASDPITLPIAAIQHDFLSVVSDADSGLVESEDIWLSCYKADEPSVHGKVTVTLGEPSRLLELHPRDGVGLSKNAARTKVSLMRKYAPSSY